jgi:hypothetical protein
MKSDELALEVSRMNRAVARCLSYLADELPEAKRGDYLLLLKDVQEKYLRVADAIECDAAGLQAKHARHDEAQIQ